MLYLEVRDSQVGNDAGNADERRGVWSRNLDLAPSPAGAGRR